MRPRWTVLLDAGARTSGAEVGGKASRLADVARLGMPVPEAFALTAAAFDAFCAANGIDRTTAPATGVAERVRAGTFPVALAAELHRRLAALPGETFAVRSSALAEDGATCSMAGQLETFLGVRRDDVLAMVKACWAALFGPVAQAYAARHGLPRATGMGVVVQRQLCPRWAGVLFTLDPVTGSADHFVIEWIEGLGDALVSGTATPERIRVSRRAPAVPEGPEPELGRALARLVAYAAQVEARLGCPADIEWGVEGDAPFLLQARPITAVLSPRATVWTSTNMSENFPRPLTPFAWSIVDEFYTRYVRSITRMLGVRDPRLERRDSPLHRLTGVQGARVCYNIRSWYELLATCVPGGGATLRRGLDHYIGQTVPVPVQVGEEGAPARRGGRLARILLWPRLALQLLRGPRCLARFEARFLAYRRALRRTPYEALDAPALVERLDALLEDFMERHWHRQCVADLAVLVFPGLLDALLERWATEHGAEAAGTRSARLLRQPGTSGTQAAVLIARLADGLGGRPDLLPLLARRRYGDLLAALPAPLRTVYDEFMERFGSRCYHECLIVSPTFEERPDLLWDLVEKYGRAPEGRIASGPAGGRAGPSPGSRASHAPPADPAAATLRSLPLPRRLALRLVLGRARRAIALREQGRLVQSLLFGEIRRLALALGHQLVTLGHLAEVDDVFFLHSAELRDLCTGKMLLPETLPELIALRRRALARRERQEPPECVVLPAATYVGSDTGPARHVSGAALRGVGASGGRARGTARVVLDPATDRFEPGEILVARSTDPGWTALFAIAGALVLERGGILSHGAIVAREFGVPAVVGVEGITTRLRGGEEVLVDGDSGAVVVLAEPEAAGRSGRDGLPRAEAAGEGRRGRRSA